MGKIKIERVGDNIIQFGDAVRVEAGPKRITAIATEELLHDSVTAQHYYAGTRDFGGVPKVGLDALGKEIKLGEEMTYLAWGSAAEGGEAPIKVYYVYLNKPIPEKDRKHDGAVIPEADTHRWTEIGAYDLYEEAIAEAQTAALQEQAKTSSSSS